jgi:hypothetical protein
MDIRLSLDDESSANEINQREQSSLNKGKARAALDIAQFDFTPGNIILVVASQWSGHTRRDLVRDIDQAIDAHTAWAFGRHPLFKPGQRPCQALHVWDVYDRHALRELMDYQSVLASGRRHGDDGHHVVLYVDLGTLCPNNGSEAGCGLPAELAELIELTSKMLNITVVLLADAPHFVNDLTDSQRRNIDTIFYMDAPMYTDEVYAAWFTRHFDSLQLFRAHEVLALQHGFVFTLLG